MMSIDASCEIASGGGGGLPYVCTSRAIDLHLLFNDYGPGDSVCSVGLCWVGMQGHRKSRQYLSAGRQGLRAWLRASRALIWQIRLPVFIRHR